MKNGSIFAPATSDGTLAQMVEQWTENPCVPGSIPGGTTKKSEYFYSDFLFLNVSKNTCFRILLLTFDPVVNFLFQ